MHSRFRHDLVKSREGKASLDERLDLMQSIVDALQVELNAVAIEASNHFDPNTYEGTYNNVKFNPTPEVLPTDIGSTYWDEQDQTLSTVIGAGVVLQHGQEMYVKAVNKTDATILNGSVVFVSGAQGNRPKIELADANSYASSSKILGVVTANIAQNAYGFVTIIGLVRDLNTDAFNEGDCLYLSETAGQLTKTPPTDGVARIRIGMCVKKHVTDGWVCVRIVEEKYMFGDVDNGNYSYFEADGTIVSKGNAITYRDEYVGGEWFVPQGTAAPDVVTPTIGGVVTRKYAFDGVNISEVLGNTFEVAHDIALVQINAGTLHIEFHLHIAPSTTGSGTCRFAVDWCLIKANGAPIAGTQLVLTKAFNSNTQYHNTLVGANLVTPEGGFGVGDLIEFTITRTPAHQDDTYENDVIFYKAALHVPVDMNGSRQIYTK